MSRTRNQAWRETKEDPAFQRFMVARTVKQFGKSDPMTRRWARDLAKNRARAMGGIEVVVEMESHPAKVRDMTAEEILRREA